ncbi:transposase [Phreatobacter stygius]|uniref:Helix-turn-helix domain-containing protein n=1 Tax=Phreatobacter stygius TaxID=1940610 RepID=A0A4D7B4I4_9HYPH|nr:helix-turn-helix domain-containing protein [Phreatobacter stygius]QCI63237.1 helix-turn-helix domain-containing protein [Phreatobacter stygius]QCI66554.1 helix-turn-helix domain-containing protein [Phreatobacter stygius]QCI67841.1 helix-turn-helix domain-containing protein [Phreatobacter stygius]
MPDKPRTPTRSFPPSFKQAAMSRLEAGETLAAVARGLGISRKVLYGWRALWRAEGASGLCHKRGPKPGLRARRLAAALAAPAKPSPPDQAQALANAQARIGELERIIGRQQAGLDFFQRALQALDADKTPEPSVPGSTRSSKP